MEIEIQELIKEDSVNSFNFFLDNENDSISNEEEFKLEKEGNEYNLTIKAPKGLENIKPYIDFSIDSDLIFNKLKLELEEGDTFNLKFKDLNINKLDLDFFGSNDFNEFNFIIDISDTVVNKIGCRNYVIAKTYCEIYNLIINNNTKINKIEMYYANINISESENSNTSVDLDMIEEVYLTGSKLIFKPDDKLDKIKIKELSLIGRSYLEGFRIIKITSLDIKINKDEDEKIRLLYNNLIYNKLKQVINNSKEMMFLDRDSTLVFNIRSGISDYIIEVEDINPEGVLIKYDLNRMEDKFSKYIYNGTGKVKNIIKVNDRFKDNYDYSLDFFTYEDRLFKIGEKFEFKNRNILKINNMITGFKREIDEKVNFRFEDNGKHFKSILIKPFLRSKY